MQMLNVWILLKQQNTEKLKAIRGYPGGYTYLTGRNRIGILWIFSWALAAFNIAYATVLYGN